MRNKIVKCWSLRSLSLSNKQKNHQNLAFWWFNGCTKSLRREGDSNPRSALRRTTVFETAAFNRSAISPEWTLKKKATLKSQILRRKRDSNPRRLWHLNGFQDRRNRPLCHFSAAKIQLLSVLKSFPKKRWVSKMYLSSKTWLSVIFCTPLSSWGVIMVVSRSLKQE